MAKVFLSYAREDEAAAKQLAEGVGRAGHDVWWDRHIQGGSRFSAEIDRELKSADAVVVLWSEASVESAWVQDEAAEGRDSGRLVPVSLNGSRPPLGFRQFHTVELERRRSSTGPARGDLEDRGQQNVRQCDLATQKSKKPQGVSICVLPFVNMSGDPEQEYFSDGITEDIITDLSKVSALFVVARNTAFTFKGKVMDVKEVAQALDVSHVLEGSVRKAGDRVRITAQLIDAKTGGHVWADRYDRDLTDIFAIQDEISKAIVAALRVKLLPEEKKAIETRGTASVDAYNLYLMARQHWISWKLRRHPPRRNDRPDLPAGGVHRSQLCRGLGADGARPVAAALVARAATSMRFRRPSARCRSTRILAEARCVKAHALEEQGREEEAIAEIETALRLDPEFVGGQPRGRATAVPPGPRSRRHSILRKSHRGDGDGLAQPVDADQLLPGDG